MATRFFNLIILDESGSMFSIAQQAVGGVNETIQTIKSAQKNNENQQHFISIVTFNSDRINELCTCQVADTVSEFAQSDYCPNSCTPLYDAMGQSLTKLRRQVGKDDKVLVTIVTDGYENSSREFSGPAIKKLVGELKEQDWVFNYIGANQDVEAVAKELNIDFCTDFKACAEGTSAMFDENNEMRCQLYGLMAGTGDKASFSFKEAARKVFKK